MQYLPTDSDGRDWLNREWGPDKSHTTDNENHRPHTYHDPLTAVLLAPAFEEYPAFTVGKLFTAEGTRSDNDLLRPGWFSLKTLSEVPIPDVTETQRITFGIVCALNVVTQPDFCRWAFDWLSGKDRTPESAGAIETKMLDNVLVRAPEECLGAGHAAAASVKHVLPRDVKLYTACAAHRAWADSLAGKDAMNLTEIATVVFMFPPEQIGQMLEGK